MPTVLVVDDDPDVAEVVKDILASRGYRVMTAHDSGDALLLVDAHHDPIDLLLADVLMPGLNGQDLVESVRARWPRMRVLLMSGYALEDLAARGLLPLDAPLLRKPLTVESLISAVRDALAGRFPPA